MALGALRPPLPVTSCFCPSVLRHSAFYSLRFLRERRLPRNGLLSAWVLESVVGQGKWVWSGLVVSTGEWWFAPSAKCQGPGNLCDSSQLGDVLLLASLESASMSTAPPILQLPQNSAHSSVQWVGKFRGINFRSCGMSKTVKTVEFRRSRINDYLLWANRDREVGAKRDTRQGSLPRLASCPVLA